MQRLKKRFLDYLNKENFDHTQGSVDPYQFHNVFIFLVKMFSVMDDDAKPFWQYVSPVFVVINGAMAAIMCSISIVKFSMNFQIHLITECGTYLIVMIYELILISCTFLNKKQYCYLLQSLREDFDYVETRGKKYSKEFFDNQKLTFKAYIMMSIFIGFTGSGMMACAILAWLYTILFHDKNYDRPLMYPFWLFDWDLHVTPLYEGLFILSASFTFSHTYCAIFMIETQIIWARQIMCKADFLIWSIQDLLVDVKPARNKHEQEYYALLITHRMREIIGIHHSMITLCEAYAAVYRKCLLFEQKFSGPLICLTAYCSAEKFDAGEVQVILLLLCVSVAVYVFIPNYLSTVLREKVQSVNDACWNIPFWGAGPVIRPYLVLMMQRSVRPLPTHTAGFDDISLETYANILMRAYSWFNMLRQANFEFAK